MANGQRWTPACTLTIVLAFNTDRSRMGIYTQQFKYLRKRNDIKRKRFSPTVGACVRSSVSGQWSDFQILIVLSFSSAPLAIMFSVG